MQNEYILCTKQPFLEKKMQNMPLELFLSDEIQALLDDFAALLEVRVTFFSAAGDDLRRGKAMTNCDYCRCIQDELGQWPRCVSMDQDKRLEALKNRTPITYRCHAGLRECIAQVKLRGIPAGFVMMGQFRLEGDQMPEIAGLSEAQQQRMRKSFDALPCFTEEKLQAILGMLRTLIDYISVRELAVLQGDRLKSEIDKYIEKHITEDIKLPEMARKLGRSVSSISQFLRKNYHTTFKSMVLESRLRQAEIFWKKHPDATVAETAFAVGFKDQFYFSRVFHRLRGMPPGKFRESTGALKK